MMQYKKYSGLVKNVKYFSNINCNHTSLLKCIYPKGEVVYAQYGESPLQGLNIQVTNLNLIRKVVAASSAMDSFKKLPNFQNNKLTFNKTLNHLKGGSNPKDIYRSNEEGQLTISKMAVHNAIKTEVQGEIKYGQSKSLRANECLKFFLNKIYAKPLITLQKREEKKPLLLGKTGTIFTQKGLKPVRSLFKNLKTGLKSQNGYSTVTGLYGPNKIVNTSRQAPLTHKFENSYSKLTEINLITINLASANRIRQWAEKTLPNGKVIGEVINPETIHYKTLKPIKGGLFCERIFGPLKDHECACGKKFNIKNYLTKTVNNSSKQPLVESSPRADKFQTESNNQLSLNLKKRYFCRICDVEYTYSIIRRTQLGYIQLASPTTHVWFVKGIPSYISILLDMKKKHLQSITYNIDNLTLENSFRGRQLLPVSPSSIFESWQKIMKTQYPEKYDLSNTGINKLPNTLPLGINQLNSNKSEKQAKTKLTLSKPLNLVAQKGVKYKKPKTKKALYKQYLKKYYARKPKTLNSTEVVPLRADKYGVNKGQLPPPSLPQIKINKMSVPKSAKIQYLLSKKGWFKLIQYVIKSAAENKVTTKRPVFQSYKDGSQEIKTNIFIALNDNIAFLDAFLSLRSPQFLTKYLKDLDHSGSLTATAYKQNPNLGLISINTIFSFSSYKLSAIYKNELLKRLKMQAKNMVTPLYMLILAKDRVSPPVHLHEPTVGEKKLEDNILNATQSNSQTGQISHINSSTLKFLNAPSISSSTLLTQISLKCYNFLIKFYNNPWSPSVNSHKSFVQHMVKLLKKSSNSNIVFTPLNSLKLAKTFNHHLWYTKMQNQKQINPLFSLITSLKLYTFNLMEHNLNKIALMFVLNLIKLNSHKPVKISTKKETNGYLLQSVRITKLGSGGATTTGLFKEIKIWQLLTPKIKIQFILKFFIKTTFTQPLGFIKQFNFLKNQKAYQSIKSIKNYVKLPCYTIESDLAGEINAQSTKLKGKNLFGSLYYCSSLKILKIFTLYFFFFKKTKKQMIYKLYNSVLADLQKLKNKYFRYLMLSFTLFSYKKHLTLISPLTTLLVQLSQKASLDQMVKKTKTIFSFNCNSLVTIPTFNEINLPSIAVIYPGQSIKLLCAKFYGVKATKSLSHANLLGNRVVLLAANKLDRFTEKGLISVKGSNMYLTPLKETLIKVKIPSKLSFSKISKKQAWTAPAAFPNIPQREKITQMHFIRHMWQSKIERQPYLINISLQTKNAIVNNIYCLSHRELWEQDKDWQDFVYYYYSPGRITDKLIPLYKSRNYDSLFSIDNTLSNTSQTTMYSLGMNINTAFSGAGLIQKLLNDFNFTELKKMDKQNRILLFQYNKHVQKLKKVMETSSKGIDTSNRKSRYQYYKACHIRDVLIRRTKLTRKIFNKFIPNDNFKTVDEKLTLKLASSGYQAASSAATNKNVSLVNRNGVSKLQALQNPTETNGLNMILTLLPVLPPVLRPVLKMSGQFTISDLNRLYQRIIYRNERLKKFLKDPALSSSFEMKYAQRLLQEAVDNLIQNGKSGVVPEKDARGRLLKSLSDILKGKQGRFRQYLLGKRVDYSGRSVIVVGPRLKLHECGIPKEMALVLYSPFLIKRILNEKLADTYLSAKKLIRTNPLLVSQLLREIMKSCPVLLNRAPTLHRLGFQAFQPKLVDGKAILLHPLVCPAFNADFDGDQMAVHVPITFEARAEAWKLMLARNNLLSPATGEPLILPSQDMVLGCYYLTTNCAEKWSKFKKGSGMYFHNIHEVLKAYNQQLIHLHAVIWVNIKGHLETANNMEQPLEIRIPLTKKYLYSPKGSYNALTGRQEKLPLPLQASKLNDSANGLITKAKAVNLSNINVPEGEIKKNMLDLTYLNLNYLEIYSKTHNLLNINQRTLVVQTGPITDPNINLPQLTTQIIQTTPGKILFNTLIKNAIEKRPRLLSKSSFKGGFIKNKLVNAIDQEIDNYFIRKNTAIS